MTLTAKDERGTATTLLGTEGATEIHQIVDEVSRDGKREKTRVGMELILGSEIYMSMEIFMDNTRFDESDEDKLKIPYIAGYFRNEKVLTTLVP